MNRKFWQAFAAVGVTLLMAGTVYAATTFGSSTGPTKLASGYQFTIGVTAMSNPDSEVCLEYSVNGGAATTTKCTCATPSCNSSTGAGTWVCTIPTTYPSSSIAWDMSAYSGNCGSKKTQGITGAFSTNTTAVNLASLNATPQSTPWLLPVGVVLLVGIALLLIRQRRA